MKFYIEVIVDEEVVETKETPFFSDAWRMLDYWGSGTSGRINVYKKKGGELYKSIEFYRSASR